MAYTLTVRETAEQLGIGIGRVHQLIEAGDLTAEKVGSMWFVDSQSIDARANRSSKPGRPSTKRVDPQTSVEYTLMNRTHEVLTFRYDNQRDKFSSAQEIYDISRAPLGVVSPRGGEVSAAAISFWWKHRTIPKTRDGVQAKLEQFGLNSASSLPFVSLGLSLSDQYWIREQGTNVKWEDVNFFHNEFTDYIPTSDWLSGVGLNTPDNTSEGELPKKWICDGSDRVLLKGGSVLNQEPFNEIVATALYHRLFQANEYVPYEIATLGGLDVCKCSTFITSQEEYIPAWYVTQIMKKSNNMSEFNHYLACCEKLGVVDAELALSKILVCDQIIANFDRHWRNFGLIRNVDTCEYRVAPIFDSGNSLWCQDPVGQVLIGDYRFKTKPFFEDAKRQLRLVNDASWFDGDLLEGFANEAEEILLQNPQLKNHASALAKGIQHRIEVVSHAI